MTPDEIRKIRARNAYRREHYCENQAPEDPESDPYGYTVGADDDIDALLDALDKEAF